MLSYVYESLITWGSCFLKTPHPTSNRSKRRSITKYLYGYNSKYSKSPPPFFLRRRFSCCRRRNIKWPLEVPNKAMVSGAINGDLKVHSLAVGIIGKFEGKVACPARFERATYALEEFVAAGISNKFNSLQRKSGTVQ